MSDSSSGTRPIMALHKEGSGPPLIMLHGGFGCWRHWIRNIGPLSEHFTVYAFDLPSYGESASVPSGTSAEDYLEIVCGQIMEHFPGGEPLRLTGFSFGSVISSYLAGRLKDRVSQLALLSPAGFPPMGAGFQNMMSFEAARGDEAAMTRAVRHNLLMYMLFYPETVDDEAMEIHRYSVDNTRFDSRKVSRGGPIFGYLEKIACPMMLLWAEKDDFDFRPADTLVGRIREVVPDMELHYIPHAAHWSAFENAPAVNSRLIDFFTRNR